MLTHKYILYIDDNPDQLELFQRLIEQQLPNAIVDVCCSSAGAEEKLNEHCYDLVVCDVLLPGELGTTIIEKILERDPQQAVYLMTAYASDTIKSEAKRIGVTLLPKPWLRVDEFIQEIQQRILSSPCSDETQRRRPQPISLTSPHIKAARASALTDAS